MRKKYKKGLSKRQHEVVKLRLLGYTYQEVAQQLGLSAATIRNYVVDIYRKLEVHNVEQLYYKMLDLEAK